MQQWWQCGRDSQRNRDRAAAELLIDAHHSLLILLFDVRYRVDGPPPTIVFPTSSSTPPVRTINSMSSFYQDTTAALAPEYLDVYVSAVKDTEPFGFSVQTLDESSASSRRSYLDI